MVMLYQNPCSKEVGYKGTALLKQVSHRNSKTKFHDFSMIFQ